MVFLLPNTVLGNTEALTLTKPNLSIFLLLQVPLVSHHCITAESNTRALPLLTSESHSCLFFFCSPEQRVGSWVPDQGSNPRLLQWKCGLLQALDHQGSPSLFYFYLLRLRSLRLKYKTQHHKTPRRECRQNII